MNTPIPDLRLTPIQRFVEQADLSQHDLSGFVPTRFEFEAKAGQRNKRLPQTLLAAVKVQAKARASLHTVR